MNQKKKYTTVHKKVLNFIEISSLVSNKNFSSDKNILPVSSRYPATLNWSFSASVSFVIFTEVPVVGLFH